MRMRTLVAVLAGGAALSGCMTGPDYVRPDVAAPTQWTSPREGGESDAPVSVAAWWTTLNDPVLNQLAERSVNANLDLKIAEARVREARAARGIAASALLPSIGAAGSWTRSQALDAPEAKQGLPFSTGLSVGPGGVTRSLTVRGQNGSITRSRTNDGSGDGETTTTSASFSPQPEQEAPDRVDDVFQLGFDAAWELDIFGGNRRAVEAAEASIGAAEERRRDVLVSLLAEVARNYIELRATQSRLDITNKNIEAQAETVELTKARFDAGLTSELDAVRAEALLTATQSQVPFLETQIAASMYRLAVLLGEDPGALNAELSTPAPMPAAPAEVPVGLPSDLLRRRPDIRATERELAAATARIGEATAELFPKFYLTGSIAGRSPSMGDILNSPNQLWSVGPSVSLPIFRGGQIRANIEVQNARQEQAAIAYEQSILLALEEVENGLMSFSKEQVRRKSLDASVTSNQEAVRLANERYVRGLETFLNVLQAQQQLFESQDLLVQSESFVLTDLISLYKALGGGWEIAAPEAVSDKTASNQSATN